MLGKGSVHPWNCACIVDDFVSRLGKISKGSDWGQEEFSVQCTGDAESYRKQTYFVSETVL